MEPNTQLSLPEITHDQALILSKLYDVEKMSAHDLRHKISYYKMYGKTSPAFYQRMGRMEDSGFISNHKEYFLGREYTFYSATQSGREALKEAISFYEQLKD